jgi:hypothetical protein
VHSSNLLKSRGFRQRGKDFAPRKFSLWDRVGQSLVSRIGRGDVTDNLLLNQLCLPDILDAHRQVKLLRGFQLAMEL